MPLLEEVTFFMVWFDPDLPVLRIHLNNTGPTARLTARCYRARFRVKSSTRGKAVLTACRGAIGLEAIGVETKYN